MTKKKPKKKTLGQELIEAVREAAAHPERCRTVWPTIDVASIRKQMKLSQQAFADNYHIRLQTLRQWEQGLRSPDSATIAYLTCIARKPETIRDILRD